MGRGDKLKAESFRHQQLMTIVFLCGGKTLICYIHTLSMRVIARLNGSFDFYNYLQTIRYLIRSAELNHLKSSKRFNKVVEIAIPHTISEKFRVNKIKLCTVCFCFENFHKYEYCSPLFTLHLNPSTTKQTQFYSSRKVVNGCIPFE